VRHRGTIGGSLAHADPSADLPAVMLATNARHDRGWSGGRREIARPTSSLTCLTSALGPNEVLTEIRIPLPAAAPAAHTPKHPIRRRVSRWSALRVVTLDGNAV